MQMLLKPRQDRQTLVLQLQLDLAESVINQPCFLCSQIGQRFNLFDVFGEVPMQAVDLVRQLVMGHPLAGLLSG